MMFWSTHHMKFSLGSTIEEAAPLNLSLWHGRAQMASWRQCFHIQVERKTGYSARFQDDFTADDDAIKRCSCLPKINSNIA